MMKRKRKENENSSKSQPHTLTTTTTTTKLRKISPKTISPNYSLVIDIDGVVYKGGLLIKGSKKAIEILENQNIPYCFMTNGGGESEKVKSTELTNLLNIQIPESKIILSHTPFKGVVNEYRNKKILIISYNKKLAIECMNEYGFKNMIFIDDYMKSHPYLINFKHMGIKNDNCIDIVKQSDIVNEERIEVHEPPNWYPSLQICLDILVSNGKVGSDENIIDYTVKTFCANPDFEFSGIFSQPRLTCGAFRECLESLFKMKTGKELKNMTVFGKPNLTSYKYVQQLFKNDPKTIYVIGDNPKSDIQGAIKMNWVSILVKTGIFKGDNGNDKEFPANYICNDLLESVKFIVDKENE